MDIVRIAKEVTAFDQRRATEAGGAVTETSAFAHVIEELGEVAKQNVRLQMRPEKYDHENYEEEIVDVILTALVLARVAEVDLERWIPKKLRALYARYGWEAPEGSLVREA